MGGTTSKESPPGGSESRGGVEHVTTKISAAESELRKQDSTSTSKKMNATARGHPATASETRQDLAGAGFLTAGATWLRDNTVGAKIEPPAAAPETAPPNEAVAGDRGDDPAKIAETRPGNTGGSKLQQTAESLRPLEQVRLALPPGAREALTTTTNEVVAKINRSAGRLRKRRVR